MKRAGMDVRRRRRGWLFLLPAVFIILVVKFYPMVQAFLISLTSGVGAAQKFVGIMNYVRLTQDSLFRTAMFNTVIYLVQIPLMLMLALILASLLNRPYLKGKGIYRTMVFLPCVMAGVSYSMVFRSMFATNGLINKILIDVGLIDEAIQWLAEPWLARLVILIAMTWRWTGYNTIFYLSGLQGIDSSLYEAAEIDGANKWQQLTRLTIPLLKPVILLTVISSINGTLQLFTETKAITAYGPGNATITLANYIFKLSFEYLPQYGYSSAISYVVFLMVAVLAILQMKVGDKR